jgi:hypothetical protein
MFSHRWRPLLYLTGALIVIWAAAFVGFRLARNATMTAEKVQAYAQSLDLNSLSAADRRKALRALAQKLNALSLEERRKARFQRQALKLFEQMTEEEKSEFVDATMPTGFRQMLVSFEEMPEDQRKRSVDEALRRLRSAPQESSSAPSALAGGTNAPVLSPELESKIRSLGLKTFYSQSSAQTKAELAPVLEEIQRLMESGRPFRGH